MTSRYYTKETQTLRLPPPRAPHARTSAADTGSNPAPALPLYAIVTQPYACLLRSLILANRRLDKSFALPAGTGLDNLLPNLEELNLQNCSLMDRVPLTTCTLSEDPERLPRIQQEMLPLIIRMFPNLQTLDLSENALYTSLSEQMLRQLLFAMDGRKGLRHLRLRGNRLRDLDGFKAIATSSDVSTGWTLEELDVGYNDIWELPPELGMLPLKSFLVEGNAFLEPDRKVWKEGGTPALLQWLRDRL